MDMDTNIKQEAEIQIETETVAEFTMTWKCWRCYEAVREIHQIGSASYCGECAEIVGASIAMVA